jgi:hypothetical protein
MPFDGRNAILATRQSLVAAMFASRVEPVDPDVLVQHKADELRRHPAGWFYRHSVAVQITTLVLLLAGTIASFAVAFAMHPAMGIGAGLAILALATVQSAVPVRGPALWRERTINELGAVHPIVRDSALRLQEQLPEVKFRLGELIQDRTTLDPYLIAEYRGERAVLGIWDDATLIAPTVCHGRAGKPGP